MPSLIEYKGILTNALSGLNEYFYVLRLERKFAMFICLKWRINARVFLNREPSTAGTGNTLNIKYLSR